MLFLETPYEHHLYSMGCKVAIASEHYLDITTKSPAEAGLPFLWVLCY
jgi:hypothetical protein